MNSDFEELLKIFNGNEVKYLVVGGYAVMLYTEPRYTKDLDVWFGAPLAGLGPGDFAHKGFFYQNGQPPVGQALCLRRAPSPPAGIRGDTARRPEWPPQPRSLPHNTVSSNTP